MDRHHLKPTTIALTILAQIVCGIACQILNYDAALAEDVRNLLIRGNLNNRAGISQPPPAPDSHRELADSAFYSFSAAIGRRDSDQQELDVTFYFWKSSVSQVVVRAYVDAEFVGGASGIPTLAGRTTLAFHNNGAQNTGANIPESNPSGYLLDRAPEPTTSSDMLLTVLWLGRSAQKLPVSFEPITLTKSPSLLLPVASK